MFETAKFFTIGPQGAFVLVTPRAAVNASQPGLSTGAQRTGRVRDQWHTMTRTGKVGAAAGARTLSSPVPNSIPTMHAWQASRMAGLRDWPKPVPGARWWRALSSLPNSGAAACSCRCTGTARYAGDARPGQRALVNPATDPISGQPESKHTPVKAAAYSPEMACVTHPRSRQGDRASPKRAVWVGAGFGTCWRMELAGDGAAAELERLGARCTAR